ncbi:MAG: flagellar biosynthetic protein FliR [Planctomycetota bacterium]
MSGALMVAITAPLLAFVRILSCSMTLPFLDRRLISARVRLLIGFALATVIAPTLIGRPITTPLPVAVLVEATIGLLLGFLVSLITTSARLAGEIVTQEMGLSIASVIDPLNGAQVSVVAQLFELLLLLLFFAVHAHHAVLRVLFHSFDAFPLGNPHIPFDRFAEMLLVLLAGVFDAALRMALPLFSVLALITVVVALLSRSVPQVNVLEIGLTSRILVGLAVAGATLPGLIKVATGLIEFFTRQLAELVSS